MKREERFELKWVSSEDGKIHSCVCLGKEQRDNRVANVKAAGKYVSCKKLYPFSTNKNQHNFMLISNICSNRMYDMAIGDVEMDAAEYDRLDDLKDKADKYFCLPLPVAWLPYEEWAEAKELATMAISHRQEVCVQSGHPEWVSYC